jgi:hypothetical protein
MSHWTISRRWTFIAAEQRRFWQNELRSRNGRYKQGACRICRRRQWKYNNFGSGKCLLAKACFCLKCSEDVHSGLSQVRLDCYLHGQALLNTGLVQRIEFIYFGYYAIFLTGKWLLRLTIYGCKFLNAADIYFFLKSYLATISKQSNEMALGTPFGMPSGSRPSTIVRTGPLRQRP